MIQLSALIIPLIFLIVWLDYRRCVKKGIDAYNTERNIANVSLGVTEQLTAMVSMVAVYFWVDWVYEYSFFQASNAWYNWVILFFLADFCFYWSHRYSHTTNIFWASHVAHHQSEDYNLLVGFRLGSFQFLTRFLFWLPMPLLGFKLEWIAVIQIISGLYQWLLHTQLINKLGVLEHVFMTPSLHRVHHGKNDQYIDKNYGSTLIIWDKLFGTYAEEVEEVKYGIKSPWRDENPYMANFHHYVDTWKTALSFKRPFDKLLIWFKPPGWLPKDSDAQHQYGPDAFKPITPLSPSLSYYIHTQMIISIVYFMLFYLYHKAMDAPFTWFIGIWLLLSVLNCGFLVSRKGSARNIEIARMVALATFSLNFYYQFPLLTLAGLAHSFISTFWLLNLSKNYTFKNRILQPIYAQKQNHLPKKF